MCFSKLLQIRGRISGASRDPNAPRQYRRASRRVARHCHMYVRTMTSRKIPANERRSVHVARSCSITVVTPPPPPPCPPLSQPVSSPSTFPSSCVPFVDTIAERVCPPSIYGRGVGDFTARDTRVTVQRTHGSVHTAIDTTRYLSILCRCIPRLIE